MALRLALVTSVLALAARALLWSIIDVVTPFGILPIAALIAVALGVSFIIAVVHLARHARTEGGRAAAPLAIIGSTVALLVVLPFNRLSIEADYVLHRGQRARVVALFRENRLETVRAIVSGAVLKLPPDLASASRGSGEIVTCGLGPNASLLFFTYAGVLKRYSGFLYRPDGTPPPDDCLDGQYREVVRMDDRWFFVAH